MLQHAWYLITDRDYWNDRANRPALPQAGELTAILEALFDDEAGFSSPQTNAAMDALLQMAEHLSGAVPIGRAALAGQDALAHLLHGLYLATAYLSQISDRLAHQVKTAGTAAYDLTDAYCLVVGKSLAQASLALEQSAARLAEAHLNARSSRPSAR